MMLSIQKQPKYVKKMMQLPNGELALVVFELREINGKVIAKAVYGEILKQQNAFTAEEVLALPVYTESQHILPLVSPFFSHVLHLVKDLSFVTSQSTRAPSFI